MIYPLFYDLTGKRIHVDPKAQALIDQVDPVVMADIVADFPAEIPAVSLSDHCRSLYLKLDRPPKGERLNAWLEENTRVKIYELERDLERYHALREFGALELSIYDMTISSSTPYCGVATALRLKTAHVLSDRRYLDWYAELQKASTAEEARQGALF